MTVEFEFKGMPKIPRFSRDMIITEKIDGTNAQVHVLESGKVLAAGRNRYLTEQDDNYKFWHWVQENETELRNLGPGRHYGEWWGYRINRGYGLKDRRFSLFDAERWILGTSKPPDCCHVVPILSHPTLFCDSTVLRVLSDLGKNGSVAANGFMEPEGIIIHHLAANVFFKKTLKKDEKPKDLQGEL